MCGIFCSILQQPHSVENCPPQKLVGEFLKNRGPDSQRLVTFENATLGGYVLWQQGAGVCDQPVASPESLLLFNGDVFGQQQVSEAGDSAWLAGRLDQCQNDTEICEVFRTLQGPYSLVYLRKSSRDVYFGRDSLGRNSLLIEKTPGGLNLLSSSYSPAKETRELPPVGLYKLNLAHLTACDIYPWSAHNDHWQSDLEALEELMHIEFRTRDSINPDWLDVSDNDQPSFDFYKLCGEIRENSDDDLIVSSLLAHEPVQLALDTFGKLLDQSVKDRVQCTPPYCVNCLATRSPRCHHSKVALLFSGGVDCTVLALLADRWVQPEDSIDLVNVAFEKDNATKGSEPNWQVPDRLSSYESLAELRRICPDRNWNLVEVNVSRRELQTQLQDHIKHLIYPLNTVLDESLGCAFWFASRGSGLSDGREYKSPARVAIVGSGADELFGGYVRHRNAYRRCPGDECAKQLAVHRELEHDWRRIPARNLARDDRAIGDNGKTSRAPFLEEGVVRFVRSLKASQRCCFGLREGLGDKLFLRLYAHTLGLRSAMRLKKRAIQFGSKIAIKQQNASDISEYLKC